VVTYKAPVVELLKVKMIEKRWTNKTWKAS
jgi:hypothetical protein